MMANKRFSLILLLAFFLFAPAAVQAEGKGNIWSSKAQKALEQLIDSQGIISLKLPAITPRFARLGLGQAAHATDILSITSTDTTASSKALNITHTGAITGTGYAGYFSKTGASTTNVGLYATATGATNNYAAVFDSGNVGIGTTGPVAPLNVRGNSVFGAGNNAEGVSLANGTTTQAQSSVLNLQGYGVQNEWIGFGQYYDGTWKSVSANAFQIYHSGTNLNFIGDASLTANTGYTPTIRMTIQASGNVGIGTTSPLSQLSLGLPNGQQLQFDSATELTTIAAAASTATAIQIPLNAVVFAVSVRVVTAIPTAATFTVTGTVSGTTFNTAAVSTTANSTDLGTAACPYKNGAAQTITITPNLSPAANTGRVRVTVHYYIVTPATS